MTCASWARSASRVLLPSAAAAVAGSAYLAGRSRPAPPAGQRPPEPPAGLPPARVVHLPGRGEVFVRDSGEDDPDTPVVLLLHGWMFSADVTWFTCYEQLGSVGRVVAPDHRGHGRGIRPSAPFRLADVADDTAALLHELGTPPVVAVGYSMGGTIAQLLWQRHPELVRGLVLCATSASFSEDARDRWAWRSMGALQLLLRLLPRDVAERVAHAQTRMRPRIRFSHLIHQDTPAEVVELLPWIIGEMTRNSAEDIAEAGREMGRFDARGWLGSVDVPTAVIVTARDALVPAGHQRAIADLVTNATVQELPLDHDGVVGRPDLFVPALVKAVQQALDH